MIDSEYTFLDTDIYFHRISTDPPVREAARDIYINSRPTAISEFSFVELKSAYLQDLKLLREKIAKSESFERAYNRVFSTGGRKAERMLSRLLSYLGGEDFSINPWEEAQQNLLVLIDTQIQVSWIEFSRSVDSVFRDFNCTRAGEEPTSENNKWIITISKCTNENKKCKIIDFIDQFRKELKALITHIKDMESDDKTKELERIKKACEKTLNGQFPWEGSGCRTVGDLLIALQSKSGKELVSSNHREHSQMCGPLEYTFRQFPFAELRSK